MESPAVPSSCNSDFGFAANFENCETAPQSPWKKEVEYSVLTTAIFSLRTKERQLATREIEEAFPTWFQPILTVNRKLALFSSVALCVVPIFYVALGIGFNVFFAGFGIFLIPMYQKVLLGVAAAYGVIVLMTAGLSRIPCWGGYLLTAFAVLLLPGLTGCFLEACQTAVTRFILL